MATSTAKKLKRSPRPKNEYLPESDGAPMAETDAHRQQMIDLLDCLAEYFRADPKVYVTGNIFLYLAPDANFPNEPRQFVSPDIFVVKGIKKKARRIYDMAKEKKAPDVVIELVSRSTRADDMGKKRFLYAEMGVTEYFIFDPLQEALGTQLHGFRLIGGAYMPLEGSPLRSNVLGLDLLVEDGKLRLYNTETGERLRTHEEAEAERRLEIEARKKAEIARRIVFDAHQKAEAEIIRLKEELAKYQNQNKK